MSEDRPNLETAYALETPQDNRVLYAGWAETYDHSFAAEMDFLMPGHVARAFHAQGGCGPVLDAGAGTGLVAAEILATGPIVIDAFDLSAEMLAVARAKGHYRRTTVGDLTATLPFAAGSYRAVVSSGTFTHGHVGPHALDELMRVAAADALFVLTIKKDHYAARGFAAKFAAMSDTIKGFDTTELPIYGPGAKGDHRNDLGLVAVFRKI